MKKTARIEEEVSVGSYNIFLLRVEKNGGDFYR